MHVDSAPDRGERLASAPLPPAVTQWRIAGARDTHDAGLVPPFRARPGTVTPARVTPTAEPAVPAAPAESISPEPEPGPVTDLGEAAGQPDAGEPGFAATELAGHDFMKPDFIKPGFMEPDLMEPDFIEPDLAAPDAPEPLAGAALRPFDIFTTSLDPVGEDNAHLEPGLEVPEFETPRFEGAVLGAAAFGPDDVRPLQELAWQLESSASVQETGTGTGAEVTPDSERGELVFEEPLDLLWEVSAPGEPEPEAEIPWAAAAQEATAPEVPAVVGMTPEEDPPRDPLLDLADRLERLSRLLRAEDLDAILPSLARGDRFDALVAGFLAGYFTARDG